MVTRIKIQGLRLQHYGKKLYLAPFEFLGEPFWNSARQSPRMSLALIARGWSLSGGRLPK